jgi:hypothetical protein
VYGLGAQQLRAARDHGRIRMEGVDAEGRHAGNLDRRASRAGCP